jgi:hypothetical protein
MKLRLLTIAGGIPGPESKISAKEFSKACNLRDIITS